MIFVLYFKLSGYFLNASAIARTKSSFPKIMAGTCPYGNHLRSDPVQYSCNFDPV